MNYVPFSKYQIHLENEHVHYLSKVYFWMTLALIITGFVSLFITEHPQSIQIFLQNKWLLLPLVLGQLLLFLLLQFWLKILSKISVFVFLIIYSFLNGITLASVFLTLTLNGIQMAFFATAGGFLGLSLFNFLLGRDVGALGAFIGMLSFGLLTIFSISKFMPFLLLAPVSKIHAGLGIFLFSILVAYDIQKVKSLAIGLRNTYNEGPRSSLHGALTLYLDFVNLFFFIILLMGDRKR